MVTLYGAGPDPGASFCVTAVWWMCYSVYAVCGQSVSHPFLLSWVTNLIFLNIVHYVSVGSAQTFFGNKKKLKKCNQCNSCRNRFRKSVQQAGKQQVTQTQTWNWKLLLLLHRWAALCRQRFFQWLFSLTAVIHKVLLPRIPYQPETMATGHWAQFPRLADRGHHPLHTPFLLHPTPFPAQSVQAKLQQARVIDAD